MAFRPTLVPTLFTAPALIALLALGTWQVQRMHWKDDLIQKLEARATVPAVDPPTVSDDLAAFEYRRIKVRGTFRHDRELYLVGRSLGGQAGLHVLTPLERAEGPPILVDRGWVPFDRRDPAGRPKGQIPGPVTLEGLLRLEKGKGTFQPDNDAGKNSWYFVELDRMATTVEMPLARGYYLVAGPMKVPGSLPVAGQWRLKVRNDHLQYAITWFSLALALLVIYILYHRQRT
jgi:surfeit locus 1 family protein